jgi:hypothetical protein
MINLFNKNNIVNSILIIIIIILIIISIFIILFNSNSSNNVLKNWVNLLLIPAILISSIFILTQFYIIINRRFSYSPINENLISNNNTKHNTNYNTKHNTKHNTEHNLLIIANNRIQKLIDYINNKYSEIYLNSLKNKVIIQKIIKKINLYDYNTLYEYFPEYYNHNTSININKGKSIHLCLREYDTYKLHDINDIIFVLLHEISHSLDENLGHTKSFWSIFNWLLQNAIECNIYKLVDYKKNSIVYCSTLINYQPLLDNSLKLE